MTTPLGNDLAVLISEIEANISHAESLCAGLSREQFNWAPAPGRWSIGQNLAHLNIVNGSEPSPMAAAIAEGRKRNLMGTDPFTYGMLSRKFIASQQLPVKKKFKAPKYYQPPLTVDAAQALAEYRRISAQIRALAQSAAGLDLARVKTTLPALPALLRAIIRMPLGARFELLTTHDRRHLWHAEEVRNHADFPAR
jgi:DinB family protein